MTSYHVIQCYKRRSLEYDWLDKVEGPMLEKHVSFKTDSKGKDKKSHTKPHKSTAVENNNFIL